MDLVRRCVPDSNAVLVAAGVGPVLARVYAARGITSADELDSGLAGLPSFASIRGATAAACRLASAIADRESIIIVGDYDADGATACALGTRGLSALGACVDFLVPNRFEDGYGLTPEIVTQAAARGARLIVTVDNGIASHEGVAAAATLGIEVIVTDHHLPAATLPFPALIVDPNQPECLFPSKHLAGVGVMFYVLLATRAELRAQGRLPADGGPNLGSLLDLVALGTVADVVRLDRVNRILVAQGLARIRAGRAQPGVLALFEAAGRDPCRATTYDLGFVVGPRLNAAGRLADMALGVRCLLAGDPTEARQLAATLDRLNRERRELEAAMHEEAVTDLEAAAPAPGDEAWSVCVYQEGWHEGVIGILASRLRERYHRPVIAFAPGKAGQLKGSGRSIPGFNLRDALDLVSKREPGLLSRFGGHAFAAGLTLPRASLAAFVAHFEQVAKEALTPAHLKRSFESDGALGADELTFDLAVALRGEVWGQGFPPPVFDDEFEVVAQRVVGERHARLTLQRGDARYAAIAFNQPEPLPARIRAAYRADVHEWNGTQALELVIEHWWAAAAN